MRAKDKAKIAIIVSVAFIGFVMVLPIGVSGGGLEPSGPPAPTMTTLNNLRLDCPTDDPNKTNLLFPFITNLVGWDTGIAISNTSRDPWSTVGQSGTCTLNFYTSAGVTHYTTGSIQTGGMFSTTASSVVPGFQGYMIATCNFPYAHGFATITDYNTQSKGSMGYLPLIVCTDRNRVERLLP